MDHRLVDAGDGRRLEQFGERLVDRPAPTAVEPRRRPDAWAGADLRHELASGWRGALEPWVVALGPVRVELRPTASGGLGLFPEHLLLWPWLADRVAERDGAEILHLFAHTGATTLALAAAGAQVTHVDGARPAVAWARRNADISGLADRPIRWIVDDAAGYVAREARRGRRYDGIVLDPPSFGHGPRGRGWRLDRALDDLLAGCAAIATDDAFVLLTAHTTGLEDDDLATAVRDAFEPGGRLDILPLTLTSESGAILPLGHAAGMIRR